MFKLKGSLEIVGIFFFFKGSVTGQYTLLSFLYLECLAIFFLNEFRYYNLFAAVKGQRIRKWVKQLTSGWDFVLIKDSYSLDDSNWILLTWLYSQLMCTFQIQFLIFLGTILLFWCTIIIFYHAWLLWDVNSINFMLRIE